MKLKCVKHDQRVMVLPVATVHRQDGSHCDSSILVIGDAVISPEEVRDDKTSTRELLQDIFLNNLYDVIR